MLILTLFEKGLKAIKVPENTGTQPFVRKCLHLERFPKIGV
jgi:hypothetical protein